MSKPTKFASDLKLKRSTTIMKTANCSDNCKKHTHPEHPEQPVV